MTTQSQNKVCFLLVVWGKKYIKNFLNLSLPSLLAEGNIPAFCQRYETHFIFLTRSEHVNDFNQSPSFQKLKNATRIEFIAINDLITVGNYSTTITLAYERAIKHVGKEALNTYFIFLVADYIMANGSGKGLLKYIDKGFSGICTGNFQVIKKEDNTFFSHKIDPKTHALTISSSDLLNYGFKNLHPSTTTSFYNQNNTFNPAANRFFFPINGHLIGLFYLLHMICIKPETLTYTIGASCDYSFISEMCPSGNIGIITDSDDYLVLESQEEEHELNLIQCQNFNFKTMAKALATWTTKQHRANANHPIIFHSKEVSVADHALIKLTTTNFLNNINQTLNNYPYKPYRNHPYWIGAMKAFNQQKNSGRLSTLFKHFDDSFLLYDSTFKIYYNKFFGRMPNNKYWHPYWYEGYQFRKYFKAIFKKHPYHKTIVFYESCLPYFISFQHLFENFFNIKHNYHLETFLNDADLIQKIKAMELCNCIIFTSRTALPKIGLALTRINHILKPNALINIIVPNEHNHLLNVFYDFSKLTSCHLQTALGIKFYITQTTSIKNTFTHLFYFLATYFLKIFNNHRKLRILLFLLAVIPIIVMSILRNTISLLLSRGGTHCAAMIMTIAPYPEPDINKHQ